MQGGRMIGRSARRRRVDFNELFRAGNWVSRLQDVVDDPFVRSQFLEFIRTPATEPGGLSPFSAAMLDIASRPNGPEQIAEALRIPSLRRALLDNYDYDSVRHAMADLFTAEDGRYGQPVMLNLIWGATDPSLIYAGGIALRDIITTMFNSRLPGPNATAADIAELERQGLADYNRYRDDEDRPLRLRANQQEDFRALRAAFRSDRGLRRFLASVTVTSDMTAEQRREVNARRSRFVHIFRTQDAREMLNEALRTPNGRRRAAELLPSEGGINILLRAMTTPQGVNTAGYLWNMPYGRVLLSEMLNSDATQLLEMTYTIIRAQMAFGEQQRAGGE